MALHLTIIKFPPGVALGEDRKTVSGRGVRIGRGQSNDWVLMDPERFLSSKHCEVLQEGDRYFLVDLSTNGTYLNGSSDPMGRGKRSSLNDGDSFDVGDYRFKVTLAQESMNFPDDPFKDSPSQLVGGKSNVFGSSDDLSNDIFMSNQYGGEINDIAPDEFKVTDPLLAIDNAQGSGVGSKNTLDDPLAGLGSFSAGGLPDDFGAGDDIIPRGGQHEGSNRLTDAAAWPEAKPEQGLLPDDWGDDISLLNARAQPPAQNSMPKQSADNFLPDDDSLILNKPSRGIAPGRSSRPAASKLSNSRPSRPVAPAARKRQEVKKTVASEPPKVKSPPPTPPKQALTEPRAAVPPSPASSAEAASLIDALGLDRSGLSDEQLSEINATVGVMMRESLEGLMQILRARTSIKNEFRINITTIQPVENNPIKFSANVDEILELMFVKRTKAYKEPVEAVQESFETIADHQMAMIAGIRSAFKSALGKFDPILLQEEFKQMGKSGFFKGSSWNAYEEYYQSLANDMERAFHQLFGDDFVQAYEDQLRKLAHARKLGN